MILSVFWAHDTSSEVLTSRNSKLLTPSLNDQLKLEQLPNFPFLKSTITSIVVDVERDCVVAAPSILTTHDSANHNGVSGEFIAAIAAVLSHTVRVLKRVEQRANTQPLKVHQC